MNHIDTILCSFKDLYKYINKEDVMSIRVDEIVRWNKNEFPNLKVNSTRFFDFINSNIK